MRLSHLRAHLEQQLVLKGLISEVYVGLVEEDFDVSVSRVSLQANMLKEYWHKFEVTHEAINVSFNKLDQEDREKIKAHAYFTQEAYTTTQKEYIRTLEKLNATMSSEKSSSSGSTSNYFLDPTQNIQTQMTYAYSLKLPRIDLPKFNGNMENWLTFKDFFSTSVLVNPTLSDVQRLQYLKASLVGNAAHLLKYTTITALNFKPAWESVVSYYENKRLLVSSTLQSFFNIKKMTKESAKELENLYTTVNQLLKSLETMGRPVAHWDDILVFVITQRLDLDTLKAWEHHLGGERDPPTWSQLREFLGIRQRSLQAIDKSKFDKPKVAAQTGALKSHFQGHSKESSSKSIASITCGICGTNHHPATCAQYASKSQEVKRKLIIKHHLCFNCLGAHKISNCTSTRRCIKCGQKHHTSLHLEKSANDKRTRSDNSKASVASEKDKENKTPNAKVLFANADQAGNHSQILLATARIIVRSSNGNSTIARALIDQGSEISLVTERLAQRLKLPRIKSSIPLVGVGGQSSNKTRGFVSFTIRPHFTSTFEKVISAHILSALTTAIPTLKVSSKSWKHLEGLQLADPYYSNPGEIDLLLGADVYGQLIDTGIVKGGSDSPIAQQTQLGWIVSGPTSSVRPTCHMQSYCISQSADLYDLLQRFWELDSISVKPVSSLNQDEQECEEHFCSTHSRDSQGRYVVCLPFKASSQTLGDSKRKASLLCHKLVERFSKNAKYAVQYSEFMDEYLRLGHMRVVPDSTSEPSHSYYLPHHGVWKESSLTTKLRVVFNASSPSTSGRSLNDILHPGEKLQTELFDVLIYFRQFKYAFSADIEKMFRQVKVCSDDWKFQRIFWTGEGQNLVPFELTTVTYGMVCAPFLSLRVLMQLTKDEGERYPKAISVMTDGRYVDDLFGGSDSIMNTRLIIDQVSDLCMAGGFPLRKWVSNEPAVLESIASEHRLDASMIPIDDDLIIHSLGLLWHPMTDEFSFELSFLSKDRITKRSILSTIAKIFDPLGFLAPVIIIGKLILQRLWTLKLDWDQDLPDDLVHDWIKFINDCDTLPLLTFPRWIGTYLSRSFELHGFCDASSLAMAAVVFVRTTDDTGKIISKLICSKTKVAPLKRLTIPRLELSGAVLLVKLVKQVLHALHREDVRLYLWCDSSITLTWINNHPSRWKDFVHNRVCYIQETLPSATWRFVRGSENPADLATRGLTLAQLSHTPSWWYGPSWLSETSDLWPSLALLETSGVNLEERPVKINATSTSVTQPWDLLLRYSSLLRLLKVTATCMRAVDRFKRISTAPALTTITPLELHKAKAFWTKEIQRCFFPSELRSISTGQTLPKSNCLIRLTPFIDAEGILRVGGRLQASNLSEVSKHPAILPKQSPFTSLIIGDAHIRSLHGGTQLTTLLIREEFWVVGGRTTVRSHILKCVKCLRFRQLRARQLMGQLPPERVLPSRPFLNTGVDYAGPFTLKTWKGKNARTYKAYIVLFVCFATSAVHLELVTDYTTEAFLAAYKRFVSRRGICATLISDCGTNFKGASSELQRLFDGASAESQRLSALLAKDGTTWRFNPPSAPHFGGKWESGVKSVKYHLKRVMGETLLTYEELNTLLTQIEAVLNSRPLCPLTDDPDDLSVLTPGHFLMGCPPTVVPEPSLEFEKSSRLSRWQLLRQMLDSLWVRWSSEYLQRHYSMYKWNQNSTTVKEGSMVLVVDERYPPGKWPLGRITKIFRGPDGLVRVVMVKTCTTELKRPITKLCFLPTDKD
ncbi:uncharacterized protein [Linepithema humile]|uniref:uncharacterized protein n=1 Tax=Linepithema humile TaxID=83485 RepID=UPI00351ECC74